MASGEGIIECEKAFERLLDRKPNVAKHVGLESEKITASVVSVEAGFDAGYLKKSRKPHQALIARIEANKGEVQSTEVVHREALRRSKAKNQTMTAEMLEMKADRDRVLSEHLTLVERILELEKELKKHQNVLKFDS